MAASKSNASHGGSDEESSGGMFGIFTCLVGFGSLS